MFEKNCDSYRFSPFSCLNSLFLSLLIWNDTYKIMIGCPSYTYPSIHLFMALTLKNVPQEFFSTTASIHSKILNPQHITNSE